MKLIIYLISNKIQIIQTTNYGYLGHKLIFKKISMAMKFGDMVNKFFKEELDGWKFWTSKASG
jgi:hypothetical protein